MSSSVVLSDGDRELELVASGPYGIFLQEFNEDFSEDDVTYAESIDGEGRRSIRKRPQNVERSMTIGVSESDLALFWRRIDELQEIVASVNRDGGTLVVDLGSSVEVTFTLERAHLSGLPGQSLDQAVAQGIVLEYERSPFGKLEEITLLEEIELTPAPVVSFEVEEVPGHVDAFGNLTITDESDQTRAFVEVGQTFEYDEDEPLYLEGDDLELDATGGALATRAGSHSTHVVRATVSQDAVPICRTGPLSHIGRKRVYARAYVEDPNVQLRLAWRIGEGAWEIEPWKAAPAQDVFFDLAIGVIEIERAPGDEHSWEARVDARVATGFADVDIDLITPFGADRYGRATSAGDDDGGVLVLADDFTQADGQYNGKSMDVGGVVDSNDGDANDAEIDDGSLVRTATGDAGGVGWWAVAPPEFTDVTAYVQVFADDQINGTRQGLMLRYVDPNNYAVAFLTPQDLLDPTWEVTLLKRVGGSNASIGTTPESENGQPVGYLLAGLVTATIRSDGRWAIQGPQGQMIADGVDDDFATGGDLESGRCGVYDFHSSGSACRRVMNGFRAYALPQPSPVIIAGGSAHFLHDKALRESVPGSGEDPTLSKVARFRGRHLRLRPSTRARRKTLVSIRARRFDTSTGLEDVGLTDEISATLAATPRVLLTAAD